MQVRQTHGSPLGPTLARGTHRAVVRDRRSIVHDEQEARARCYVHPRRYNPLPTRNSSKAGPGAVKPGRRSRPAPIHYCPAMAAFEMVVDKAQRLHGGIHGGLPDETEPQAAQLGGEGLRLGRRRRQITHSLGRRASTRLVPPYKCSQRNTLLAQASRGVCVRDGSDDLATVADDPCVREQPVDVGIVKAGDRLRVEPRKRVAEILAFSQDGKPGKAGLETFETELLEHPVIVADRQPPLVVMVSLVLGCRSSPATSGSAVLANYEIA